MSDSYKVTVEKDNDSIFPAIIGFVVLLVIIALAFNFCDSGSGNVSIAPSTVPKPSNLGAQSTTIVQQSPAEPAYLAYLYVKDCDSEVTGNNIREGITTDAFGHKYEGPYFVLTSFYYAFSGVKEAYTELVTDEKYEYLSGEYFLEADGINCAGFFQIYADGALVYESGPITENSGTILFDVCINNARTVKVSALSEDGSVIHVTLVNAIVYNP